MRRRSNLVQGRRVIVRFLTCVGITILAGASCARAEEAVSLKGQTVNLIVGFASGGGTDAAARVLAPLLGRHLPGQPTVVVRNMPGAFGITAVNYLLNQTKPDGLTISMGSNSQVDPVNYRKAPLPYEPGTFRYFGGIGRGGYALVVNKNAEKRLSDRNAPPVIMGSIGGWPRAAMQVTVWGIEYLGWNARWVTGYQGTNPLMLALERGEIEMTSTGNLFQIGKLVESGSFRIVSQSGALQNGTFVGRPEFGSAPVFGDLMDGKINDPVAKRAFEYWVAMNATDKFLYLAPETPARIVDAYRKAFRDTVRDPEFAELGHRISDEFAPVSYEDIELLIRTLTRTPNEVVDYLTGVLAKQGLKVAN
jgi:tripartite-type tricarboxylate transporter receptor subunit TctC